MPAGSGTPSAHWHATHSPGSDMLYAAEENGTLNITRHHTDTVVLLPRLGGIRPWSAQPTDSHLYTFRFSLLAVYHTGIHANTTVWQWDYYLLSSHFYPHCPSEKRMADGRACPLSVPASAAPQMGTTSFSPHPPPSVRCLAVNVHSSMQTAATLRPAARRS